MSTINVIFMISKEHGNAPTVDQSRQDAVEFRRTVNVPAPALRACQPSGCARLCAALCSVGDDVAGESIIHAAHLCVNALALPDAC